MLGCVKSFNNEKGFGFLICNEIDKDIFVHYSNILGDGKKYLYPGDRVSFDVLETEKGLNAINVEVLI